MNWHYAIKTIEPIVAQAKPGVNVTQEQYDIMKSTLKMAKQMRNLYRGTYLVGGTVLVSVIGCFVVKYGYDFDLGIQIQYYVTPITVVGGVADVLLIKKLIDLKNKAHAEIKKLHDINMSQMFR